MNMSVTNVFDVRNQSVWTLLKQKKQNNIEFDNKLCGSGRLAGTGAVRQSHLAASMYENGTSTAQV
jgi:hypothetical protein